MALLFDGVNDYAITDFVNNTGAITMHAWVRPTDATPLVETDFWGFAEALGSGTLEKTFLLQTDGKVAWYLFSGSVKKAITTTILADNTWYSLGGTHDGTNNQRVWLNSTNEASLTGIGASFNYSTPVLQWARVVSDYNATQVAECALWNVELSAAEMAALAAGYSAKMIRPASLLFYAPMFGTLAAPIDIIGGRSLTVSGAVKANHPRTIYPSHQILQFPPVAAAPAGGDVADTLGLSDTILAKLSAVSSITDTLGLADTIVDKKSAVASLADTLGLSDTILAKVSAITGPADTLGISDSIVSKLSFESALADTLGLADTIAAIVSGTDVFLTDTLGLSDTISIKLSYSSALSDTLGISDSIDPTNAFFRALVDTLGISDTIKTGVGVGLSDTLGISDSVAVQMSLVSLLVDTLGLADTLDLLNTFNVSLTDTLGLSDVISTLTSPQDLQIICQTCGSGWRKKDTRQMYHFKGQTIINNTSPSAIVALGETMQFCPKCNVRELLDLTKSLDSGPEALRLRTIPEHAEKADSGGADVVHDSTRQTRK